MTEDRPGAPPAGTLERWCHDLVSATELDAKLRPGPPPDPADDASWEPHAPPRRPAAPGRPACFRVVARSPKTPRPGALARPEVRAQLVHTFLHHELQAAELFAWAVLAFPGTPREFRAGLVRQAREELAHLALYAAHLETLGAALGDFPVRDWFWRRGTQCETPVAFLAFTGLGLEGANLEHTARFAAAFREAGDEAGAVLQERIGRDEERHVAFALDWFRRLAGGLDYDRFRAALPPPLTPAPLRGLPLNLAARKRAGFDDTFLERLAAEPPAANVRAPAAHAPDPTP